MDAVLQSIKEAFDALGLILVFVFVLFDVKYPQILKDLDRQPPPPGRELDRSSYRKDLRRSLLRNSLPLIVIDGVMLYLLLPLTVRVLQTSRLELWNFDFQRASFLAVALFIAVFFLWSIGLGVELLQRISKAR